MAYLNKFHQFSARTGHVAYSGNMEIPKPWSDLDLHRGRVIPDRPLIMRHNEGGPLRDVVITGYAMPVVVSEKFTEALTASSCTGWSTFSVSVYDKSGRAVVGYYGFQVIGVCGPIDWSKSTPVAVTYPGGTFPMLKGMWIDEHSWDRSDVFGPADSGETFMTSRAADALKRARITNMELQPAEDVVSDIWPGDGQRPWKHLYQRRWDDLGPEDLKPRP